MKEFEVVVIGAGPAGGHCARQLAKLGHRILLVEQHASFDVNNYSSAGSPLEILEQFALPDTVVARYWRNIEIIASHVQRQWRSPNNLGVVFDFKKLRQFLADDTVKYGGEVWLGHRYVSCDADTGLVYLKPKQGEAFAVKAQMIVDATGYSRAVMYPRKSDRPSFYKATGIEYLIEVTPEQYQKYADSLVFFLGYKWSPQGYSWIFPMDQNQLKVGSAIINAPHKIIQELKPLREYTERILQDYMGLSSYRLIEIHGSVLEYASGLQDQYFRHRVVAIGDAVSTVNFLGGEGIRHGMRGAEIAVKHIHNFLSSNPADANHDWNLAFEAQFTAYQKEMLDFFAPQWNLSEQIGKKVYLEYSDARIDQGVSYLKYLSITELIDILFYYKMGKVSRGIRRLILQKLDRLWLKITNFLRI
ncbi:MAG: NAD(P)/FAD-dependent oxidoreductase [Pseudanabaenaceae cyanobacterium bins.39]|nr:NAD(P)/FAD-dependent oxidoreductase [Pseudanabaenaceae cyanobacterium bins.39]